MKTFFHVGIVVMDLAASMSEMSELLGVQWEEPHTSRYGDWEIQVVYSLDGPPYLELIQGGPGGPWDNSRGQHLHHIGYWSDDVPADSKHLAAHGAPIDFDPATVGLGGRFCYHVAETTGVRIEVVTSESRARLEAARAHLS